MTVFLLISVVKTAPKGCDIRKTLSWKTSSVMEAHAENEDCYRDTTRKCVIIDFDGEKREITYYNDPLLTH